MSIQVPLRRELLWALLALWPVATGQEVFDQGPGLGPLVNELSAGADPSVVGRPDAAFEVWERRAKAVSELSRMDTNAWPAIPSLLALAGHPDFQIGMAAATILARIKADEHPGWAGYQGELQGNTNAFRAFAYLVTGKDDFFRPFALAQRRFALSTLGAVGPASRRDASALLPLLQSRSDEDRELWAVAVQTLQKSGVEAETYLPGLRALLQDSEAEVDARVSAARALGASGSNDPETLTLLRDQLRDSHSHVRVAAARALWTLKEPAERLVATLLPLLSHKLVTVRTAALLALSGMGGAAGMARSAVQALLTDTNASVRQAAATALERIPERTETSPITESARRIPDGVRH